MISQDLAEHTSIFAVGFTSREVSVGKYDIRFGRTFAIYSDAFLFFNRWVIYFQSVSSQTSMTHSKCSLGGIRSLRLSLISLFRWRGALTIRVKRPYFCSWSPGSWANVELEYFHSTWSFSAQQAFIEMSSIAQMFPSCHWFICQANEWPRATRIHPVNSSQLHIPPDSLWPDYSVVDFSCIVGVKKNWALINKQVCSNQCLDLLVWFGTKRWCLNYMDDQKISPQCHIQAVADAGWSMIVYYWRNFAIWTASGT